MTRTRFRRGAVLPMVLVVMVIIALAAAAALFTGRLERRASWNARLQTSAFGAADLAHAQALDRLAVVAPTLEPGASTTHRLTLADGVDAMARLTRLGSTLFMLTADANARSRQGLSARRRASLLLHLDPPSIAFPAALTIVGATEPGAAVADGTDRVPAGWPCGPPRTDSVPVRHPSPAPDTAVIAGLRERATITLPAGTVLNGVQPVVRDGACATDRPDNWGDPDRAGACRSRLPIVHARGDLTVHGGMGQGFLLVDGDLTVGGGFRFVGAVIVGGTIDVSVEGASLSGGVVAGGFNDRSGSAGRVPIVLRSSCAVDAALLAAGALAPVVDRAWASVR